MNPFAILPNLYYVIWGVALVGWVSLFLFPRSARVTFWFAGLGVPVMLSLTYTFLLVRFWLQPPQGLFREFLTLAGVYTMFSNEGLRLVGITDMITMDLFVGAWMARKAAQTGMPRYMLWPCLLLTLLFAGFGFALFSILASIRGRWSGISNVEQVPALDSEPVVAAPYGMPHGASRGY